MDYSHNFLSHKAKKNLFPTSAYELFDLNGIGGVKLPQPPTPPTRIPRDVAWWARNRGQVNAVPKQTSPVQDQTRAQLAMILSLFGNR